MKTIIKSAILAIILLTSFQSYSQLKVLTNGNVGIGQSNPQYKLDIEGITRFSNWTDAYLDWTGGCGSAALYPENDFYLQLGKPTKRVGAIFCMDIHYNNLYGDSDDKIKTKLKKIDSPIEKLKSINGYYYYFTREFTKSIPDSNSMSKKEQIGILAQEVLKEFPQLVYTPDSGTYQVNYIGLIPVLIEAIKEQQKTIDDLNSKMESCCISQSNNLNTQPNNSITQNSSDSKLQQNQPNPFNQKTEIKYFISSNSNSASINIYNLSGTQMKSYNITQKGSGSISINGAELVAGLYIYNLIIDGKEIDSKRMILTN
jgi:hypothetical protein